MARPTKQGIEYFPLDTVFDDKIELLIAEKGQVAVSILITLWQMIYQNEGYFIKADEDTILLIKRRLLIDNIEIIKDVLSAALRRNIFDNDKFIEEKIYTSKAIQKRYFWAVQRKKLVNVYKNYLCDGVIVSKNTIYIDNKCGHQSLNVKVNVNVKEKVNVNVKEYVKEKRMLIEKENKAYSLDTKCIQDVHVGKVSIDKVSLDKSNNEQVNEIDFNGLVDKWNTFAKEYGLAQILKLTDKRKRNINQRLKEKDFDLDKILKGITESSFLLGENKQGWKVDFDFVFGSENKYIKILEGKYKSSDNHKVQDI